MKCPLTIPNRITKTVLYSKSSPAKFLTTKSSTRSSPPKPNKKLRSAAKSIYTNLKSVGKLLIFTSCPIALLIDLDEQKVKYQNERVFDDTHKLSFENGRDANTAFNLSTSYHIRSKKKFRVNQGPPLARRNQWKRRCLRVRKPTECNRLPWS